MRTLEQMRAEVDLVLREVVRRPVDQVVTFAPRDHLFGHLFGDVLPEMLGVPVQDLSADPLGLPDLSAAGAALLVCLPSSWEVLLRSWNGPELSRCVALHGTAPVTPTARRVVNDSAWCGFTAMELFGSTETGALAFREIVPPRQRLPDWQLLPDVEVDRPGAARRSPATVRGPRVARQQEGRSSGTAGDTSHTLPDVLDFTGERTFRWSGRVTDMIKVNGRRCHLPAVERVARRVLPGHDVVCMAFVDDVRGEHYDVVHAPGRGSLGNPASPADAPAAADADAAVRNALRTSLPDAPLPRAVLEVEAIPTSPVGKVRLPSLRSVTGPRDPAVAP